VKGWAGVHADVGHCREGQEQSPSSSVRSGFLSLQNLNVSPLSLSYIYPATFNALASEVSRNKFSA